MMWFRDQKHRLAGPAERESQGGQSSVAGVKPRKRRWRALLVTVAIVALVLGAARGMMPWAVRDYVNRTLSRDPLYSGSIGTVQIHLWRGAYAIHDVKLSKTTGEVPVPLFAAKTVDLAIQWNALIHGQVVGRVEMDQPEINFVDAPSEEESQTGAGGAWLQMIRDLFPFSINSAIIHDGAIHFRSYKSAKPVDVYLSDVQGSIDNLRNIRDETTPQNATVQFTATAMKQAKLDFKMTLDPFSYHPTFHMILRLLGLDVTTINDLALTYGKFDFKRGWFDLVVEADCNEGQISGYVKPLFRDLKVFSLKSDIKEDNPLQFFWQALVGAVTAVFKNHPRNQFGTLIPFTGDVSGATTVDIMATIGNIFRNAFVRGYLPRLEPGRQNPGDLHFQPPSLTEEMSTGADPAKQ